MKKIFWIASLIIATCTSSHAQNQDPYYDNNNSDDVYYDSNNDQDQDQGMSYQTFYDQLSPYGSWIDYPGYGYVWVPQANEGFSPYMTDGHWVYTDMGWTWVSDYAWGWAAFHYGRWFNDPDYGGWLWIPGYDWAPAWVTWGTYGDYYCWAPIGPRGYVNSRYGDRYDRQWNCLPRGHMGDEHINNYVVSNTVVNHDRAAFERGVVVVNNTHTYNRSVFNSGPKIEEVRKVVGHDIASVKINNTSTAGKTEVHGNQVNIYRPAINRTAPTQHAVPTKVVRPDETRPANRNNNNSRLNTPARNEPRQPDNMPARNNAPTREPSNNNTWTPPRQSTPQPRQEYQPQAQPRQNTPMQQSRPSGGFIPSERPVQSQPMPQQRSMPSPQPSFHAPSGGGGMPHGGGGGRH